MNKRVMGIVLIAFIFSIVSVSALYSVYQDMLIQNSVITNANISNSQLTGNFMKNVSYQNTTNNYTSIIYNQSNYTLQVFASASSPADSQTYYFDSVPGSWLNTIDGQVKLYIPKSGHITKVYLYWVAVTVAGSNEQVSAYVRINEASDTLISQISDANAQKLFKNTALNIPVNEGDNIQIKVVTPVWVTNPTNVAFSGTIMIE